MNSPRFEMVVGLEVHVQLATQTKLFCACATDGFGSPPNSRVCPICTGQPGVLPVLNKKAVELAFKAAIAVEGIIRPESIFARKNYFYPDLPKAYQISQYDEPFCDGGKITLRFKDGRKKITPIKRIHLEEDAGKLLHSLGSQTLDYSLIDFNRGGIALIEIVSEPEIFSSEEAFVYLNTLKEILQYAGVSSCDMEKGEMRCDANISLRPVGEKKLGTRAEIKNLNSFKNVKDALEYEFLRQAEILASGGRITQETRLWNGTQTASMRSKEEAHDYRYFPDPDLVPLEANPAWIERLKNEISELPQNRRERFVSQYKISPYEAEVLTAQKTLSDYFEEAFANYSDVTDPTHSGGLSLCKLTTNLIMTELLGRLNASKIEISQSPIPSAFITELAELVQKGALSSKGAKDIFSKMWETKQPPKKLVNELGMTQVSDDKKIREWVRSALAANPKAVEDIKGGKDRAIGSIVGAVMKLSQGKANPALVNSLIYEELGSRAVDKT